jgi:nucleoid DNA-binding protein
MSMRRWLGLGVLLGAMGLVVGLAEPARSQKAPAKQTLKDRIMALSKLPEKDVDKMLQAIGPAIRDHLRAGESVELPGLGVFRVVNIPAHRDLAGGRAVTVGGANYVEFVPAAGLVSAANAPGVVPNETVPPFQYVPLPGRDPGMKAGSARVPGRRTP